MKTDRIKAALQRFGESKWAPHLSLFFFAALTGSAYIAAKVAMGGSGPFTTAFLRFLLACLISWPILWLTHGVQRVRKEHFFAIVAYGLFQTTIYFALQYYGLQYTTSSETSLIVNTRPIFLALLAMLVYHERFTVSQWLSLMLSFAGVMLVFYRPAGTLDFNHNLGNFMIVLNALSGAIGVMIGKKLLRSYKPFTLLVYQITVGMLGLLPLALIETGGSLPLGQIVWLPLVYLALFSTTIAQTCFNWGLAKLPVSESGVYFYLVPVFTVVLGQVLFQESITPQIILGGVLILLGAFLVNALGRRSTLAEESLTEAAK